MQTRETNPTLSADDGELDLGAVGRALWRKRLWILGPTLLVALLAFVGVNLLTPRYKSEARILIDGRENVFLRPEAEKAGDRERAIIDAEAVSSQVQLVLSRDLARQVIKQLKLNENPEFDPVLRGIGPLRQVLMMLGVVKDPLRMTPEERVLEVYYDRLTVFPIDKSRVISIEFQSANPELAAKIANTIAENYLVLQQSAKLDQTRAASQWLSTEIENLRGRVAEAEAKVEAFRAKSNLFVGPNNSTLSNQQLGEVNTQISLARSQKAEADARAQSLRDMLKSGRVIETGDAINSELIRRLSEQRATLRAQLAEQSSTLLDQHPRIKELRAQIADLERQLRSEAEKLVRTLDSDARIAAGRVDQLTASLDTLKRQATSTNEQDVQLRALDREAKAQRDLLESYLAKYREASARENLGTAPTEARIISHAAVSNTPHFPKKLPIVLIAALVTFLLAAGFVTTGELLAGNVYRPIGLIRHVPASAAPAQEPKWVESAPIAPVKTEPESEPERVRNALSVSEVAAKLWAQKARRPTVVLSLNDTVVETATALAIARSFPDSERAILVEVGTAQSRLMDVSSDPSAPGVAELMREDAGFGDIIARDRASRLHLVTAGTGGDPAAIVGSERLAVALEALSHTYDQVIVAAGSLAALPKGAFETLRANAVLVADPELPVPETTADDLLATHFVSVLVCAAVDNVKAPPSGALVEAA
jgi:polysaccharide biosynthesis transport protein